LNYVFLASQLLNDTHVAESLAIPSPSSQITTIVEDSLDKPVQSTSNENLASKYEMLIFSAY